jgi:hypothetical protein
MQGSIAFRVMRGLIHRTGWVLLYVAYLALCLVAIILIAGALAMSIDAGGGASRHARRHITLGQRFTVGFLYGSLGLLAAVGARLLRQWHRRVNPLYPEMQVRFRRTGAATGGRRPDRTAPRWEGSMAMYDPDLDGGSWPGILDTDGGAATN